MQMHSHAGTNVGSERLDMASPLKGMGSKVQSQTTEGTTLLKATQYNMQDRQSCLTLVMCKAWGAL